MITAMTPDSAPVLSALPDLRDVPLDQIPRSALPLAGLSAAGPAGTSFNSSV